MHKTNNVFKFTFTAIALASLVACSSNKKVITEDDSADYQGATSLQPLKRPAAKKVFAEPVAVTTPIVDAAPVSNLSSAEMVEEVVDDAVEENRVPLESEEISDSEVDEAIVESEMENSRTDGVSSENIIASTIVDIDKGATRMEINAEFDQAWADLNENLQTSDLTVFSRNKVARRFSIGCGGIEAAPAVVKKSGWSFLNREKHERLEYCVLELNQKRGKTHVSVLNRSGVEVLGAFSRPIFERILAK